jgi:hypothetical protein
VRNLPATLRDSRRATNWARGLWRRALARRECHGAGPADRFPPRFAKTVYSRERSLRRLRAIAFAGKESSDRDGPHDDSVAIGLVRSGIAWIAKALVCLIGLSRRWTRAAVGLPVHGHTVKGVEWDVATETAASWWRLGTSGGGVAGLQVSTMPPQDVRFARGSPPLTIAASCRDGDLLEC